MDAMREESTEFWARQFAGRWYRGTAHLQNDFRRFASAYRVPSTARDVVRARACSLIEETGGRRAA